MIPQELLAEVARRGIELYPDGQTIRYRGPKAAIAELKPRLAACKAELLAYLCAIQEDVKLDPLASANGWGSLPKPGHPAYSILETCQQNGVALRIDNNGDLVVGKADAKADEPTQPWPSLLIAIQAQAEAVAALVEAGWTLKAGFPKEVTA